MKISVIVNSRDEGDWLKQTVENLADTLPGNREIVVVDDGSQDGSADFLNGRKKPARLVRTKNIGVASARNLGARKSTGDVLIFSDAHMRYEANWWRPLLDVLDKPKAGAAASIVGSTEGDANSFGYGFTVPTPDLAPRWIPDRTTKRPFHSLFLPGCCIAMKRTVFNDTGGYDSSLRTRGSIDAETGIRFWLLGYENWMVPASRVWHHFRQFAPYEVPHTDALHNRLRTALVHFSYWRVTAVMREIGKDRCVGPAMLEVISKDVGKRRRQLIGKRLHDDDWLFKKFEIPW